MQSIAKLLLLGLKYFSLGVIWKKEAFPSLTTFNMLDSGRFTSSTQVRGLVKKKKKKTKKKNQKPGNTPRLSSETFSTGSCQLLHGLCMVLELSHLAAKLTSPLAQPVKMCCFISKRYRHTGRKKCLHIKKQKKPLSHILHPCIRNIHYYLA